MSADRTCGNTVGKCDMCVRMLHADAATVLLQKDHAEQIQGKPTVISYADVR